MKTLDEMALRKAGIVQRIGAQRIRLNRHMEDLRPLFNAADKGIAAARVLRSNLPWVGLGLGLIFMLRPSRRTTSAVTTTMAALTLLWLRRGLTAWRTWRWARQVITLYKENK